MPASRTAPLLAGLLAVTGAGCRGPEDKVVRWASSADAAAEPGPVLPPDASRDEADTGPPAPAPGDGGADPCTRLVHLGCEHLGPHTEECLEGRRLLPPDRTPEWRLGCEEALDRHADLLHGVSTSRGLHACRRLEEIRCRRAGPATLGCKRAQEDAARLRRRGQDRACTGDLLLEEARAVFGAKPAPPVSETRPETGR